MELFKFSVSKAIIVLVVISISHAIQSPSQPKTSDKIRRDDSESETTESDEGTAPTSAAPATVSFASFRMPSFSFAPSHPHYPPPPPFYAQIPAPPPPPPMMMASPHHHHPYHMMTAASSPFTAYYRPLPPPPPHHMMTARMSMHPMHPLASPFLPPPPPPRTMLPVMVPIKRWDEHASLFDSILSADSGMENSFLDEPLVFDEEELLAARRHIPSPPPPPAHRRDSFDPYPSSRQSHRRSPHHLHQYANRDRDGYEPMPSENRYDGPGERIPYKYEREYEDMRHERDVHQERHPPSRNLTPVPETPAPASLDVYEEHIPREAGHPVDRQDHPHPPPPSIDEYRRDP